MSRKPTATRNLRGKRASTRPREPKNARDKIFCERWLVHYDHTKAYAEAGFNVTHSSHALDKLKTFRRYLERLRPKVELQVAKKIAYERIDILSAIAAIGYCNVQDYIREFTVINPVTQMAEQRFGLKPLAELTRDQAAAIDDLVYDLASDKITYTLPKARTRLTALTTLGEQAANFKKPGDVHNHLHLGDDLPLAKIRELKQMFVGLVGPRVTREVLGWDENDQAQ